MRDPAFWLFHLLITVLTVGPVEVVRAYRASFTRTFENMLWRKDVE